MKDEEFNLSEKIETWKEKAVITSLESIKVEDVKEFIRLLKEVNINIYKINLEIAEKSGVVSRELKEEI